MSKVQDQKNTKKYNTMQIVSNDLHQESNQDTMKKRKRRLEELRSNVKGKENNLYHELEVNDKLDPSRRNKLLDKLFHN